MPWVAWVWIGVAVVAAVVLLFCGYEVAWKAGRLRRDAARLRGLAEQAEALRAQVIAAQERLATPRTE